MNPETDLLIDRELAAPVAALWRAWSEPELFQQWIVPPPAKASGCVLDLVPGGRFLINMAMPDGTMMPNEGCFLVVERESRIVTTDALHAGFRPSQRPFFTSDIQFEPTATGCRYRAHIMHGSPEARQQHLDMGFENGWNTAIDNLEKLAQSLVN